MSAVNNCNFIGRVATDVQVETTGSGSKLVHFNLAVQRGKDATDFVPCTAWESTAEFFGKYFSKGSPVAVRGELIVNQTERDGQKRTFYDIRVRDVDFVPGSGSSSGGEAPHPAERGGGSFMSGGRVRGGATVAYDAGPDEDAAPY